VEATAREKEIALQADDRGSICSPGGYDRVFGGVPLRRLIERRIQNPLAPDSSRENSNPGVIPFTSPSRTRGMDKLRLERLAGAFSA